MLEAMRGRVQKTNNPQEVRPCGLLGLPQRDPTSRFSGPLFRSLVPTHQVSAGGSWLSPRMGCFRHLQKLGQNWPSLLQATIAASSSGIESL